MPPGVGILRTHTRTKKKKKKKKKASPSKSWLCYGLQERKEKRMFKGKGEKKNRIIRKVFIPCMTKIQTIEISTSLGIGCLLDSSR
jgi:hypothetical protein